MKAQGINLGLIPYKTPFGTAGSYLGLSLNILALIASFYNALYPASGASPAAEAFFSSYLAFFSVALLYLGYKIANRKWQMFVRPSEMDLATGAVFLEEEEPTEPFVWSQVPKRMLRSFV
jgi:amino acid transporter